MLDDGFVFIFLLRWFPGQDEFDGDDGVTVRASLGRRLLLENATEDCLGMVVDLDAAQRQALLQLLHIGGDSHFTGQQDGRSVFPESIGQDGISQQIGGFVEAGSDSGKSCDRRDIVLGLAEKASRHGEQIVRALPFAGQRNHVAHRYRV